MLSTHSQAEATSQSALAEKPGTSTGCLLRDTSLSFGASNGQYNQMSQHFRYSEAQDKLHPEFPTGSNKGKAVNRHVLKPLQMYVKKTNISSGSANKPVGSVGIPECPVENNTVELDQASVSASPASTWSHSLAQKHIASSHLHQVKALHESILGKKPSTSVDLDRMPQLILGKKPSTSVEHASRNGAHDSGVSAINSPYQQSKSSEAQNKLHSCSNVGDSSGKIRNKYKPNKGQPNVRWINISSVSTGNEINPSTRTSDNANGSTSSYPSQSLSASSSSKSLQSAKVNHSNLLLSDHNSLLTDNLHQDGTASVFVKKTSTSFQCTAKNGTFVFGASRGSSPPVEHTSVSFAQTRIWSSGSAFEGLDDICNRFSRLNISECSQGTTESRP